MSEPTDSHRGFSPSSTSPPSGRSGPPPGADRILRRCLPAGTLGLSIIGDLHQEYNELVTRGALRFPSLWYWRATLGLAARYLFLSSKVLFLRRELEGPGTGGFNSILADVRFGIRMLAKTPLLSLVAILTMGVGVGLTTQTFSAVYGSILRGLPVPGEERLMAIEESRVELGIEAMEMSIHDFLELREAQSSFEDVAAFYQGTVNLAGDEGLPERFAGAYVSANALTHLGVPPLMGRTFVPGEDRPDATPVVVLGYHVWRNRFAGDPHIVGKDLRVNGETMRVVGVMPEGFRFPFREDIWLTHRLNAAGLPRGRGEDLDVFGKLRVGVSEEAARAELEAIAQDLARRFPETNEEVGMGVKPYDVRFMPRQIRAVFWLTLSATFGVLLIACANVANLLLARASLRTKEVAVRTAMGASRGRVVRQLMVESFILAVLGGGLGVGLCIWGLELYRRFAAGIYRPYWIDPRVDLPVLIFSAAVTAVAAVGAGMIPALRASGVRIGEILKDEGRGSSSLRMGRFSHALVVGEIAVSCALLVGAGFMVKSVVNVGRVELGFDETGVLTGRIALHEAAYPDAEGRDRFFTELKERLEAEPGVEQASLGTHLPALGGFVYHLAVEGEPYATDGDHPSAYATVVSEDYFETFRVGPVQGRDFHPLEVQAGSDPVVIVNESFAARYLGGGDVLGRRLRLGTSGSGEPWLTVVGVVPDMHVGGGVGGLGDDRLRPERIYLPRGPFDPRSVALAVRTLGAPSSMAARLREVVAELDPNLPVYDLEPLDEAIEQATWAFRLFGVQFSVFGGLALFLAAVGLYGVMAFSVSQRRREMGVRMALGAPGLTILGLVLTRGAAQLGLGIAVGLGLGALMGRSMGYVLFGVDTSDPSVYLAIVGTLALTGLAACVLPARSATRADPVEVMRVS